MIKLTRLDKTGFYINPDHIECVEETPDTVITLINGNHFLVLENARIITDRIISFKSMIIRRSSTMPKQSHFRKKHENTARSFEKRQD